MHYGRLRYSHLHMLAYLQRVAGLMNISGMNLHSLLPELARSPSLQRLVGLQGGGKGLDELSRVEQGVCAQAAVFIGTPMSFPPKAWWTRKVQTKAPSPQWLFR